MATRPNQIDSRAHRVVRATVLTAAGVVPVSLSYRDADGTLVLPSSVEVQNVGTHSLQLSYESTGAEFRSVRINTTYPVIESPPGVVYVAAPGGSATYEFDITYDRFR